MSGLDTSTSDFPPSPLGPQRDRAALSPPVLLPRRPVPPLMSLCQEADLWVSHVLPNSPPNTGTQWEFPEFWGGGSVLGWRNGNGGWDEGCGEGGSDHHRVGETPVFLLAGSHCSQHGAHMLKRSGLDRQQSTGNYTAISQWLEVPCFLTLCVCEERESVCFFFCS